MQRPPGGLAGRLHLQLPEAVRRPAQARLSGRLYSARALPRRPFRLLPTTCRRARARTRTRALPSTRRSARSPRPSPCPRLRTARRTQSPYPATAVASTPGKFAQQCYPAYTDHAHAGISPVVSGGAVSPRGSPIFASPHRHGHSGPIPASPPKYSHAATSPAPSFRATRSRA